MKQMTPREAFDRGIEAAFCGCYPRKIGAVIERMPKHVREALAELKSSDIANDRVHDQPTGRRRT